MLKGQRQEIGDNSTGIQVQGDYIAGSSYSDIKAIFLDLFKMNFPQVQQIATQTANERVEKLLQELQDSFEKHQKDIDTEKFTDPSLQYEIQAMSINVARRGDKSNMKLLTELLCTVASKDCPELIELISSESLKIVPMLSKKHIDYLSLEVLSNESSISNHSALEVNKHLQDILVHISGAENITAGDIQYIACTGAIQARGIMHTGVVPSILKKIPEFEGKKVNDIKRYCEDNNLRDIGKLMEVVKTCAVGRYQLMAIGRLIGWLNLSRFSDVDVKKLF